MPTAPRESVGTAGNGAIVAGLAMALAAWPCFDSSSTAGRLVFVRGIVEAKSADHYCISLSGKAAVAIHRTFYKYFSKDWRDLFLPISELSTRMEEFHKKRCWVPFKKVPFILVEGRQKPPLDYIVVKLDFMSGSYPHILSDVIPLEITYGTFVSDGKMKFFQLESVSVQWACAVVKMEFLSLAAMKTLNFSCKGTNFRSKDELVEKVSSRSRVLQNLGAIFGNLGLGFFTYTGVSNGPPDLVNQSSGSIVSFF
ncbi:uncharacterized protein LOC132275889 [Cornus florida]|uniref:uncharacterized protein LOC132275889 n=1 Tax=Cornus florida TaxID=4283 RepID=UPI00289EAF5C|nr:uncharacterized protein LOC132275889 [Cornus florida]